MVTGEAGLPMFMLAGAPGVDELDELLVLVVGEVLVFEELHAPTARAPSKTSGIRRFTVTFRGRGSGTGGAWACPPHR